MTTMTLLNQQMRFLGSKGLPATNIKHFDAKHSNSQHSNSQHCNMKNLRHSLTGWLSLVSALCFLLTSVEAFAKESRRYAVEMVVFSYEEKEEGLSESWPDDTQIEHPSAYLKLYDTSDINTRLLAKTQPQTETQAQTDEQGVTTMVEVPVGVLPLNQRQRADIANNRQPDFFYLPKSKLRLTRQSNRLAYRKNFRILFHKGWNMPVYDRENSIPIQIKGGDKYDNLFELEGSIRLSVARYLHLDTQLYLREFEANKSTTQSQDPNFDKLLSQENSSVAGQNNSSTMNQNSLPADQNSLSTPNPSLELLGLRQYRVEHTIPLIQSRRMRSGDLHYIDHPRFGILIQLTPL